MNLKSLLPRGRLTAPLVVLASLAAFTAVGIPTATALRDAPTVPAPPVHPTRADQIQNLDQVKTAIKAYYGDTTTTVTDPVAGTTALHTFSPTGAYAMEMRAKADRARAYLRHPHTRHHAAGRKAIVLDVDDTTLNTYNYEIYSNFVYDPTSSAAFVNAASFPAVPGMVRLANRAEARGYTVFFLTGRPEAQRPGTVTNLTDVGYPSVPSTQVYLKDDTQPWITCDTENTKYDPDTSVTPSCSTIERKSETRKHIESLGYDIQANFGDQYSDLTGGYADRSFKLPNPMYYLP
jgi:HAD superfamily, subfamily IIIB (Acid phosphatase)